MKKITGYQAIISEMRDIEHMASQGFVLDVWCDLAEGKIHGSYQTQGYRCEFRDSDCFAVAQYRCKVSLAQLKEDVLLAIQNHYDLR